MHAPSTPTAAGPSAAAPPLPLATRLADYAMMTLAVGLSLLSIGWLGWADRPILFPLGLSAAAVPWWNALVSCLFFAQHSILVRRSVRARVAAFLPARYDGAFYAITSGIALAAVVSLWQPAGDPLFVWQGVSGAVVRAAALLAVGGAFWGALALPGFDMCGVRPIRAHLRGVSALPTPSAPRAKPFLVRGPYRFVRHPLYASIIVLFWADPRVTASRLLLAAAWTAWMIVGALLEERDLVAEFGERYRRYQREVPFLVPWRRPVPARVDEEPVYSGAHSS